VLQCCTKAKHDFVSKIFLASGISTTQTAVPACIQPVHTDEPKMDLNNAQAECKLVYGQVISEVLRKTGAKRSARPAGARLQAMQLMLLGVKAAAAVASLVVCCS
jgi:hypothetical protein